MATFPSIVPRFPVEKDIRPDRNIVKLGDGYEQRITVGLNQSAMRLRLKFENITETESDTIETFFAARVTDNESFDFTPPGESASKKYVCDDHKKVIRYANRATITCVFREVFEP